MGFFKKLKKVVSAPIKTSVSKITNPGESFGRIKESFKGGNFLDPISAISQELDPGVGITHELFRQGTGQDLDPASKVNQNLSNVLGTQGKGYAGNKPAHILGLLATGGGFAAGAGGGAGGVGGGGSAGGASGAAGGAGAGGAGGAGGLASGLSYSDWLRLGSGVLGSGLDYLGNRAETRAGRDALDEVRRQYDTTRADLMPWLEDGRNALAAMNDPDAFRTSPGYDFRRREGLQAVQGSAAAQGGLYSGNTLKGITEFGDNLADQEFSNWWNRLAARAGIGQTTATNLGQIGRGSSQDIASLLRDVGSSRASGIRSLGGGVGAVAGGLDNYFANRGGKINPRSLVDYSTMNTGRGYA